MDVFLIGFRYIVGAIVMYTRHKGDDLCSKSERLFLKWRWRRVAARIGEEELKKWTHFQTSMAEVGEWAVMVSQWSKSDSVSVEYGLTIFYGTNEIIEDVFRYETRLDAQVAVEKLLIAWLVSQTDLIGDAMKG